MLHYTDIDIAQRRPANSFPRNADPVADGLKVRRQPVAEDFTSSQAPPLQVARNEMVQHTVILPLMMTPQDNSMTTNTAASRRLPPVTFLKSPSPSHDGDVSDQLCKLWWRVAQASEECLLCAQKMWVNSTDALVNAACYLSASLFIVVHNMGKKLHRKAEWSAP